MLCVEIDGRFLEVTAPETKVMTQQTVTGLSDRTFIGIICQNFHDSFFTLSCLLGIVHDQLPAFPFPFVSQLERHSLLYS